MSLYQEMGISQEVLTFSEEILAGLKDRFEELDKIAEYNQYKVLHAMQKNRVSAECFAGTTGYGHDDLGRDVLEKVYVDVFHTEAALVRPLRHPRAGHGPVGEPPSGRRTAEPGGEAL